MKCTMLLAHKYLQYASTNSSNVSTFCGKFECEVLASERSKKKFHRGTYCLLSKFLIDARLSTIMK